MGSKSTPCWAAVKQAPEPIIFRFCFALLQTAAQRFVEKKGERGEGRVVEKKEKEEKRGRAAATMAEWGQEPSGRRLPFTHSG